MQQCFNIEEKYLESFRQKPEITRCIIEDPIFCTTESPFELKTYLQTNGASMRRLLDPMFVDFCTLELESKFLEENHQSNQEFYIWINLC